MRRRRWGKGVLLGILCVLTTLVAETCLFNFRALQSRNYKPIEAEAVFLPGVRDNGDGTITVLAQEAGERGIEFLNLNAHIDNAYIAIGDEDEFAQLEIFWMSTDAGNALYYAHPAMTVVTTEPASHYMRMNLAGTTPKMKLRLDALEGQTIRFDGVRFNVPRPMVWEPLRMLFVLCVLGLLTLLRVKGALFTQTVAKGSAGQLCAALALLIALIALTEAVMVSNPVYAQPPWEHHRQYKWLARSLANGEVTLDREVDPALLEMENPYDPYLRWQTAEFEWDVAFYEGEYYCYFGVVPCVIFYLPFYLLTGYGLDNLWVHMLVMPVTLAGIFVFFYLLLRRYAPGTRFSVYLIVSAAAALGCGTMFAARHPDFYAIPMMTGLMFTVWGLSLWLAALKGEERLKRGFLALGSLCMALVAGCRPQLVLASGFALFLFARRVRARQTRAGDWIAFWTPYVLIAAALMAYNAIRFSSPFDFGANYNLTTSDMTALGMNLERAPVGLWTSFLQPMRLKTEFPYLLANDVRTSFQGTMVIDSMYGGLLHTSPLLWAGALCFLAREKLKEKKLYGLCLYSSIGSIALCAFDTMAAGLLYRYTLDFAFFMFVPAILTSACVLETLTERRLSRAYGLVCAACMMTLVSALLFIVTQDFASLAEQNAPLYQHLRVITEFWH